VKRALVLFALAAAVPLVAEAQTQSGRWGSVEIGAERYRPDIDSDLASSAYESMFGGSDRWMFRLGISKALFTRVGSLEVGFRTGYFQDSANAFAVIDDDPTDGIPPRIERALVDTKLHIVPTSLSLTYRFDWHVERLRYVPLVPYVRATLERYNWWVSDVDGTSESGATNGWSATAGLAFLLDVLDPGSAREFDREAGVNHTYLFFEATKSSIDDFGSRTSWDLSDEDFSFGGGLLFVF
jgi:hypothetical protein